MVAVMVAWDAGGLTRRMISVGHCCDKRLRDNSQKSQRVPTGFKDLKIVKGDKMKQRNQKWATVWIVTLMVGSAGLALANEQAVSRYHAVIIQGAGYLPDSKKPEGVDAITKATSAGLNTYVLTHLLTEKLKAHQVSVQVVSWKESQDLSVLEASSTAQREQADLVIFAGPSHYGKQPPQLMALYPKLKEMVARHPTLVASSVVPAWYPETKGLQTLKVAEKAFEEAGVKSVTGVTLLTPQGEKSGASPEEVDKALEKFVTRLVKALEKTQ